MSKTADRNTLTYAYAAHPYSNATVDVAVISLHSSISKCESTSTTTSTESFTRDPAGYSDTVNLYQFVRARTPSSRDPLGLIGVHDDEPIIGFPSWIARKSKDCFFAVFRFPILKTMGRVTSIHGA